MQRFIATHGLHGPGPCGHSQALPASAPAALASVLAVAGGCRFANGFWSFAPSALLRPCLAAWGLAADRCLPFLRGAFGHIVFLEGSACRVLNPVFHAIDDLGTADDLDFVLDVLLCDRPALEASFLIDLYEAAWPRLGVPGDDEVYALVPALGLGGPRDPAHVQRRPLQVEMQILAQL